jgi:hypothetical protein
LEFSLDSGGNCVLVALGVARPGGDVASLSHGESVNVFCFLDCSSNEIQVCTDALLVNGQGLILDSLAQEYYNQDILERILWRFT